MGARQRRTGAAAETHGTRVGGLLPALGSGIRLRRMSLLVSSPTFTRAFALAAALATAASLTGCGHPASRAECDEIFAKNAEIELRAQRVTDPKLIEERTAAARTSEGEVFAGHCVGRRITGRAIACMRRATTAEQLDRCL
jgi:hypothetical protein